MGARVWNAVQQPAVVADIRDLILVEYDVDPDRCERDLLALLADLRDKGLIEVRDGDDANGSDARRSDVNAVV